MTGLNKRKLYDLSPYLYRLFERLYEGTAFAADRRSGAASCGSKKARARGKAEAEALRQHLSQPSVVQAGPFAGMKYLEEPQFTRHAAKVLGTYEAEIHEWLSVIRGINFSSIINIGCAEGYYAVGFARMFPLAHVIAIDIDASLATFVKKLSEKNDVQKRVLFKNFFDESFLDSPPSLLFVDIEGAEKDFFAINDISIFKDCVVIVELHEHFRPGVESYLNGLFYRTHAIRTVRPTAVASVDPSLPATIAEDPVLLDAIHEDRGHVKGWTLFRPYSLDKTSSNNC